MLELPPLSLYIHIPWCIRKCPYCDFNSHQQTDELPQLDYVDALLQDFALDLPLSQGRALHSIFIGGGTPSLFTASAYQRLFTGLRDMITFPPGMEITMEANPGSVEAEKFQGFRQSGINRLSLGIQSFNDSKLKALGRIHDGTQALRAVSIARAAGFDNLNLDLMFGLPDQSGPQALADLQQAIDQEPEHLSWYQLTIEPNTHFYSAPPDLPDDDQLMEVQQQGVALLDAAGLQRYEVSAYANQNKRSVHNRNYWEFGDYLGIGAGAHGKVTLAADDLIVRTRKIKQPGHYLRQDLNFMAARDRVNRDELAIEFMLNALRLTDGFSVALFETRTGLPFSAIQKQIEYLVSEQLLSLQGERIVPTATGQLFVNTILEEFL